MRIGLLRHFPVEESFPTTRMTAAELHAWRARYEASPARAIACDLGEYTWSQCIASSVERAAFTARTIHAGEIEYTPMLQEPQFAQFNTGALRLPFWAWRQLLRWTWLTGHSSQRAGRDEFLERVQTMADRLCAAEGDVLVVSHAGMMAYLSKELRRRGFAGPKLRLAEHARLYVYERA